MALIPCPECGKQISDKADACPHCGLPRKYFLENNSTQVQASNKEEKTADLAEYKNIKNMLIVFQRDYAALFHENKYISTSQVDKLSGDYRFYLEILQSTSVEQYINEHAGLLGYSWTDCSNFVTKLQEVQVRADEFNKNFIDRKLVEYETYFDDLLIKVDPNVRLDEEQRRAVLTDDDYCLLIAGAGAGKTTTMAAKAKYLVEKQGVKPEDIIVISYTNKAIDELKERINDKLNIPAKISTFHAFGFEILKKGVEIPPTINHRSYSIIFDFIEKKVFGNERLLKNLVLFLGYYFDIPEDMFRFKTLNEYNEYKSSQLFETIKSRLGEYVYNVADKRSKKTRTITGEYLRSIQEVQIANFLYLNSIEYEYEKPYQHRVPEIIKAYTPDFYIQQGENECYIEHFGVTENYQSQLYNDSELKKYVYNITRKRAIHKQYGTSLLQTFSQYNDNRPLLEHLKEELERNGFVLKQRDLTDVYQKLVVTSKDKYVWKFIQFMIDFIEKYKSSGFEESGFDFLKHRTDNVRTGLFLDIAKEVYIFYQNELKVHNQIDFSDMINDAEKLLLELKGMSTKPSYKYIIIDEFQDIARQRFNLTKALVDVTGAKVIAVGDDWQSIFAFAGADITLFQKFLELMGRGKEMQITHTYRNSQQLIDIAGSFVQKNPTQIQKRLISPKSLDNPVVIKSFMDKVNNRNNWAQAIVEVIGSIVNEFGMKTSILLIGRYNFDMDMLTRTGEFYVQKNGSVRCKKYQNANLAYMTAHSSKGLGYDNVVLVNMVENKMGFPSQIEDDPIMKLVIHKDNSVELAEERRLFYVALTRTKNRVYLVTPESKPSRFVVELIKEFHIPHDERINLGIASSNRLLCPICRMPLKQENNKNYGLWLYMCTNDPEVCDFMTNDKKFPHDIFKCSVCDDGYMIVKPGRSESERFYGCTNYDRSNGGCKHVMAIRGR